uniref:Uncharacterized protein n=1 Tax=Avena sativa TaxID=4498 RepID=A0ACD6A7G8_AVESA
MFLPQLLVLLIAFSSQASAIPWLYDAHDENVNQRRQQSSTNGSWLLSKDSLGSGVDRLALFSSMKGSQGVLFGGMATFDVYGLQNFNTQASYSYMCVANHQGDDYSTENVVAAGWMVSPTSYVDSETHFYTLWTADGYKSGGCYNLDCDGFVPVQNAPITPGDTLDLAKGKLNITIKIFKNKVDGDWWLYFGYNNHKLTAVGYWPKSIFTNMVDHANLIQWGGYTFSETGVASPAMGNGHWPGIDSASVRDVRFVDDSGSGYKIDPWPGGLGASISHKESYGATISGDEMFYYGGPGGCTK